MDKLTEQLLWQAGSGSVHDQSIWNKIITELFEDFQTHLGEECIRDDDMSIDCNHSSFSVWLWSNREKSTPTSIAWSAVLAGSPIGDADRQPSYVVTVDLFLFHILDRKRLISTDGKHYLQFAFLPSLHNAGKWEYIGWMEDEWGEWSSLVYPDD